MLIKVNASGLFEGTLDQWEDCFFSFPDGSSEEDKLSQIRYYCKDNGFDFEVIR
jgi:hypothetical protein